MEQCSGTSPTNFLCNVKFGSGAEIKWSISLNGIFFVCRWWHHEYFYEIMDSFEVRFCNNCGNGLRQSIFNQKKIHENYEILCTTWKVSWVATRKDLSFKNAYTQWMCPFLACLKRRTRLTLVFQSYCTVKIHYLTIELLNYFNSNRFPSIWYHIDIWHNDLYHLINL